MNVTIWFTGGVISPGEKIADQFKYNANALITSDHASERFNVDHDINEETSERDKLLFADRVKTYAIEMIDLELAEFYKV